MRIQGKGEDTIGNYIDIVKFLRRQMLIDRMLMVLFTPVERHFLRNDRKFVLDDDYSSLSPSSDDFSDISDSAFPSNDDQWNVKRDHAHLPKIMKNAFLPNRPLKKLKRVRDG